jgi:23S rRNA (uracil1939-C5)-methyltransferase
MVEDALQRIGKLDPPPSVEVAPSSSEFGTRSRMSFHLRRRPGGGVETGLHRLGQPGRLVEVDGVCLLPREVLGRAWSGLRSAWGPGARRLPGGSALRLTLREVDGGAVLVVEPEPGAPGGDSGAVDPGTGGAAQLVAEVEELVAVWLRTGPGEVELLAGDGEASTTWWGRPVRTGAGAFLQAHREAAVHLHETLLREVGNPADRRFVDAYCGVGTTGRRLSRAGGRVTGIELDPEAVRAAREGAPPGFRVLEGPVEDRLAEALPADTVILNPPRAGIDAAVADRLREAPEVRRIAYVSCDPATLARDVRRLGREFEVRSIRAFDLFPQTAHVETLLVLDRGTPGSLHP